MFEAMTEEMILERMLERISDKVDKREGSIIYDALAPAAMELYEMYTSLEMVLNESFADTASYQYLIKRAAEKGIFPTPATKAVLRGVFDCEIPIGERFSLEDLNYVVTGRIEDSETEFEYKLECEEEGEIGNTLLGELVPINYVDGLTSAELVELLTPGVDMEDDDSLRNRYFTSLNSQAFGGNIEDYKEKVSSISGIGGVKVYPIWNGGGTVKLVLIDSNYQKPEGELIDNVQEYIDPVQDGTGLGIAPIGHIVTVEAVKEFPIDVETNVTYQSGWSWEAAQNEIKKAIDEYFMELSSEWAESEELVVRVSQIENRILSCEGVLDIADTALNGEEKNMILDCDYIPVRGDVDA